jgi:hypothetical protein
MKNQEKFFSTIGKIQPLKALTHIIAFNNFFRFGAPSRPLRSLEDMIAFLSGSETYNELADFTSYSQSTDVNRD